jgi:formylglycine-generating enzyme required for sulfatase activity
VASNSLGVYHAVALKPANPFGLYDMLGNRREWCESNDDSSGNGARNPAMRGGSYAESANVVTCAQRWVQAPSDLTYSGYRVLLEVR